MSSGRRSGPGFRQARRLGALAAALVLPAGCGAAGRPATPAAGHAPLTVSVPVARFSATQRLAQRSRLTIAVRNVGHRALPDVAVTICNVTCAADAPAGEGMSAQPFADDLNMPGLANPSRPVWIVDRAPGPCRFACRAGGPGKAMTPTPNTWALGSLAPGATDQFTWTVTAVAPGRHIVAWSVTGALTSGVQTLLSDGAPARGTFPVHITPAPARTYFTPSGSVAAPR